MKRNLILISLIFIVFTSYSQDKNAPIFTDRPSQTDAVSLLPKGVFQVEAGFFWSSDKTLTSAGQTTVNYMDIPNLLLKYGLFNWLELRVGTKVGHFRESSPVLTASKSDLGPIFLAPKFKLLEPNGFIPRTSFVANFTIPRTGSGNFKSSDGALSLRLLMENTIADNLMLTYSIGTDSDFSPGSRTLGFYSIMLSTSFGDIGAFVEVFSNFNPNIPNPVGLDGGLSYLLSKNISVDLAVGIGLNSFATDVFINAGMGYRFVRN